MQFKQKIKLIILLILSLTGRSYTAYSQAQLVLNGAYVVMKGGTQPVPVYLVIHNGATTGIKYNSGGIITESEFNMIWWDIGAAVATTNYVVPFYYLPSSSYIPLTFTIGTAGTGSGAVRFSTWHGNNTNCNGFGANIADNYCYAPSDVTNMYPAYNPSSPGGVNNDNSYNVVDRFWVIDNTGYTTKPDPKIKFTYLNSSNASSEVAAPNKAIDNTLIAQRFNSTTGTWGDYGGQAGTTVVAGTTSTVQTGTVDVTNSGFFRSWTLSASSSPLPIQLTSFTAECKDAYALIQWTTATEINNDHFTVERSLDGITYESIAIVKGAGNSSTPLNYSAFDYNPPGTVCYYRLTQTDVDGATAEFNPISFTPCENTSNVNAFSNGTNTITIQISAIADEVYTITLVNAIGQIILTTTRNAPLGHTDFKIPVQVCNGIYILRVEGSHSVYTKKLVLGAK